MSTPGTWHVRCPQYSTVLHSVQTIRVKAQCSGCAVRAGNDVRTMGSLGTGRQYLPDHGMTQPFGATQPILHILIVSPHQPPAICHTLTRDCQLSATSRWAAVRGKNTPRPAEHGSDPRKPLVILHHTPSPQLLVSTSARQWCTECCLPCLHIWA